MSFSKNLQYLRQVNNMTQEGLAEKMSVSRQTISKWESGEVYPEIPKLMEISNIFHCTIDKLLKEDIVLINEAYSEISIKEVDEFRMARYVIISANPEDDVNAYMNNWAKKSGLLDVKGYSPKLIGWDFPFLSVEQKNRFGLRGYVAAYTLPDEFNPKCQEAEIVSQKKAKYASITVREPFRSAFELIPGAYQRILEYLKTNGYKENKTEEFIPCYEWIYKKDDIEYMEVNIFIDKC